MSDCRHCEHLTACWEDTAGKHKQWQCCHCGRIRSEFDAVWETDEHGPFLPQPRFAVERLRRIATEVDER